MKEPSPAPAAAPPAPKEAPTPKETPVSKETPAPKATTDAASAAPKPASEPPAAAEPAAPTGTIPKMPTMPGGMALPPFAMSAPVAKKERPVSSRASSRSQSPAVPPPGAAAAAASQEQQSRASASLGATAAGFDDSLEEGEIRDVDETPTVNGTAEGGEGGKTQWQLDVERMKGESVSASGRWHGCCKCVIGCVFSHVSQV